jgi:hypothetical protein
MILYNILAKDFKPRLIIIIMSQAIAEIGHFRKCPVITGNAWAITEIFDFFLFLMEYQILRNSKILNF